jgi:hypothetical protein
MSWTVVEVDGNGVRETRKGGTLAGEQPAETGQKPKMVTWRMCSHRGVWFPSGEIPEGWVALEAQTLPEETIKQLPEGEKP